MSGRKVRFATDSPLDRGERLPPHRRRSQGSIILAGSPSPARGFLSLSGLDLKTAGRGRANGNDQIGLPADHLASEITICLRPPLAGVALDGKVLSLDIPQPAVAPPITPATRDLSGR
jgi:hypothetical protein